MKQISAIILAAGLSRRFGNQNKLLATVNNATIIRKTTEAVCDAAFVEVIVVIGHDKSRIKDALAHMPIRFIFAEDYAKGMGHSLAAGVRSASTSAKAFAVVPGDLPYLKTGTICKIAQQFADCAFARHIIPCYKDTRGHPVILGSWLRSKIEKIQGDYGAKFLLSASKERERIQWLNVDDPGIIQDMDSINTT